MARPREYTDAYVQEVKAYLSICGNQIDPDTDKLTVKLPSIEGCSLYLGVARDTIYAWEKEKNEDGSLKYPEFSDIIAVLRSTQADFLLNNGLSGLYNPTITKVILTKHGYREGIDSTTNDKDLPTPLLHVLDNNGDKKAA